MSKTSPNYQKLPKRGLDPAGYRKMPADPVSLVELCDQTPLQEVAPVDNHPEDIHRAIEFFLVCVI